METVEVLFHGQPMWLVMDIDTGEPIHLLSEWLWMEAPKSGKQADCEAYIKQHLH